MLFHPMHALQNAYALFNGRAFQIVSGDYGAKIKICSAWSARIAIYITRHNIKEICILDGPTVEDSVRDLGFLSELPTLEAFTSLTYLIRDYSPLASLTGLKSLYLDKGIGDTRSGLDLTAFNQLERLYLGERIPHEEEVFACVGLRRLGLTKYPAKETSAPFANLKKLEYLSIAASGLSELDGLSELQHLEEVKLVLMKHLVSLRGLESSAPKLKKVWIEGCQNIGDISPLANAKNIEFLYLYDCGPIASLAPIASMKNLQSLNIGGNTNILDGNFDAIKHLALLKDFRGVHRKHYSLSKEEFNRLGRHS